MNFPANLKYTKDHEWTLTSGNRVRIGITDHAQSALGDVVFVELPAVGKELKSGQAFGVVESIKAVSDLYTPVSGKVTAINSDLPNDPALVNREPYDKAWMIEIEVSDSAAMSSMEASLLDSTKYAAYVKSLA